MEAGTTMTRSVWLLLISLALLWGGSFLFVEVALEGFKPLTIVALRVLTGAIVLHAILLLLKRKFPWDLKNITRFAIMGALNNAIPFSLIVWGQQSIDAGRASVMNATVPLFTVMLAHWLLKDEKLTPAKLAGIVIGFAGVFVLTGLGSSSSDNSVIGQIAVLGAAVSYAFASIYGRQLSHLDPKVSATGMLTASSVIMLPVVWLLDPSGLLPEVGFASILSVIVLGVACTALAYLLYFKILLQAGSSNLSLVTFLIPPGAIIMGIVFLGEHIGINDLVGVGLILTGMAIATGLYKRFV